LKATVTNLAEIREYGKNTNLINYKLTMGEWKEAFYVMSKHQIIEVPGAIQNVEDETPIYIYSTINLYYGHYCVDQRISGRAVRRGRDYRRSF
jgi:hypothetical protein